ncbi:hypothetical protein RGUI_4121 [Rhodovulum sp. P5]|uniref:DUF4376 domain-containing protein n=1 Tax=Rhodovulum sp. P5 TaxID=1564506 RepID=UPI00080AA92D|nr:hypothetical protein [Rhodovulum sp. P5]YP_009285938.1 hypothetical protein BI026_gp53 [Rhodovulum phage vB_RhkS_P1]ANT39924.1 hypothetical protein Rhks_53 [Rhodovulum phage vB_RhkS_P1]ARE38992.1 hypothetical protein RGUI_0851 [Rhodovulum sp. P5]ARE42262.1 hypothetical protein RGUI_4121 [Rhodovulum sp. P5]
MTVIRRDTAPADERVAAATAADDRAFRDVVNAERTRRLTLGVDVDIPGYGWVALEGREQDQRGILGLRIEAETRVGDADQTPFPFMDREDVAHSLTPAQMVALARLGQAWVQLVFAASWAIKAADPRPADPTDDALWPPNARRPV